MQPQLVLLQKTLLNIEGLGRQLYPELDLWKTAKPFLERWMAEQIGPRSLLRHLKENAPMWAERLPKLPNLFFEVLDKAKKGELEYKLDDNQLNEIKQEIRHANRRNYAAITGSGFVLSAVILSGSLPLYSWILGGVGLIMLLSAWPRR